MKPKYSDLCSTFRISFCVFSKQHRSARTRVCYSIVRPQATASTENWKTEATYRKRWTRADGELVDCAVKCEIISLNTMIWLNYTILYYTRIQHADILRAADTVINFHDNGREMNWAYEKRTLNRQLNERRWYKNSIKQYVHTSIANSGPSSVAWNEKTLSPNINKTSVWAWKAVVKYTTIISEQKKCRRKCSESSNFAQRHSDLCVYVVMKVSRNNFVVGVGWILSIFYT